MIRRIIAIVLLLAQIGCATHGKKSKPTIDAGTAGSPVRNAGTSRETVRMPEGYVPNVALESGVRQVVTDINGRAGVLRNAALLYRRNHAAWPQRIEDVAPYVHDVDRFESITFIPRPGGELVIRYRMKQQIASESGGTVSVFPPEARWATPGPATREN